MLKQPLFTYLTIRYGFALVVLECLREIVCLHSDKLVNCRVNLIVHLKETNDGGETFYDKYIVITKNAILFQTPEN